jgi:hypothetical protein
VNYSLILIFHSTQESDEELLLNRLKKSKTAIAAKRTPGKTSRSTTWKSWRIKKNMTATVGGTSAQSIKLK